MDESIKVNLANNLIFMRQSLNIEIAELSEITELDSNLIYELENQNVIDFLILEEYENALLTLSDYFTIPLSELMLDDISKKSGIAEIISLLNKEMHGGAEVDRSHFRYQIYHEEIDTDKAESKDEIFSSMLSLVQQLKSIENQYYMLRKKGSIGKIDFF